MRRTPTKLRGMRLLWRIDRRPFPAEMLRPPSHLLDDWFSSEETGEEEGDGVMVLDRSLILHAGPYAHVSVLSAHPRGIFSASGHSDLIHLLYLFV